MISKARAGTRLGPWTIVTAALLSAAALSVTDGVFAQAQQQPADAAAQQAPADAAAQQEPTGAAAQPESADGAAQPESAETPTAQGSIEAGRAKSVTCAACHGADGNSVTPEWPSLAGQHATYIFNQLQAYKNGERQDPGMIGFASTLSEQDMLDLAAFYAAQTMTPKGAEPDLVSLGEEIYRGGVPERDIPACIACHGPSGHGNSLAAYPRLSGQHASYMLTTMRAYAAGDRRSDTEYNQMMRNVAELLLEEEMRAVTSYVQGLRQ